MLTLNTLKNTSRPAKKRKRVGRGIGSKTGKTCGRGEKGARARAGSKMRYGKEGGMVPLFMKIPLRGFSNFRFRRAFEVVNLNQIDEIFNNNETVDINSLRERGFISGRIHGVKLLGDGELTKSLNINLQAYSDSAREKLTRAKIQFEVGK